MSRIKSIHSSLAIEQNILTLEQVTDVVNGKTVLGPPQDIREVKNAYEAYERISALDPYSAKNLLLAHKIMMEGLVKEAGRFRSGNVGVNVGKNEEKVLALLRQDSKLTAKTLASMLGLTDRQAGGKNLVKVKSRRKNSPSWSE